jgi:VIT1/CCC1 family predicted Fe2+/Mn2+ transporter
MMATGRHPDFAVTYRLAGFPVGVVVMALALTFLGVQWARRMKRKTHKT